MSFSTPYNLDTASSNAGAQTGEVRKNRFPLIWGKHSQLGARGGANQDAMAANQPTGFFAVADGVGGGSYGEIASQIALNTLEQANDLSPQGLIELLQQADEKVAFALAKLTHAPGATTLAALWIKRYRAHLLWVGDVRVLHFRATRSRKWSLLWKSQDQTYAAMGERPSDGGDMEDPARMVGTGRIESPGIRVFPLRANDILLICSDGLHRYIDETEISRLITVSIRLGKNLEDIARVLALQAKRNNSVDDISVLLLMRPPEPFRSWLLWALAASVLAWTTINIDSLLKLVVQ